jgi:arylsulfatase A-like enzyme
MKKIILFWFSAIMALTLPAQTKEKPNVLFITIDDLRPELGCYGNDIIKSPNIDTLAGDGVMFLRAYAQVPVCGASRASMHTGIRPTKTRFTQAGTRIDKDTPDAVTLGQYFKENGYYTVSIGKVIHGKGDAADRSWSKYYPAENMFEYHNPDNLEYNKHPENGYKRSYPYEITNEDVADEEFLDVRALEKAVNELKKLKNKNLPFFLAVGFARPHLPFVAPKRYWDLYKQGDIKEPDNYYYPKDAPQIAISKWGELRAYRGIPKKGDIEDREMRLTLKHGYYACVSYADDLVGQLIRELKELGLYDNTIIVLWGDHGWQLGEHKEWAKHTNFDIALRVPLIIVAPDKLKGVKVNELVEMVDVFPTLSELAGLPVLDQNQGKSVVPLLEKEGTKDKPFSLSRWQKGDSYKTDRYRYTEFTDNNGKVIARMLFDHQVDPEENVNVAKLPEYKEVVHKLSKELHQVQKEYDLE